MCLHKLRFHLIAQSFCIFACVILIASCSSSKKTASTDFDLSEYYNPYDLKNMLSQTKKENSTSKNFKYAKMKNERYLVSSIRSVSANKIENRGGRRRVEIDRGKVISEVYVDENGKVAHIKIFKTTNSSLNTRAKRIILNADFDPGKLNGQPVKSILRVPLSL